MTEGHRSEGQSQPPARSLTQWVSLGLGGLAISIGALGDAINLGSPGFGTLQAVLVGVGVAVALTGWASRRWSANLILALLSTGFVLAALEMGLRATAGPEWAMTYELHPSYLHRLIPNSTRVFRHSRANGGQRITVEINRFGFRGSDFAEVPEKPRIMVYGDSFVEAPYVDEADTFSKRLELDLIDEGSDVEVLNAGVVGYGPDQAVARMRDEIPRFKPDLVMLAVFAGNDFGDLIRNRMLIPEGQTFTRRTPLVSEQLEGEFRSALRMPVLYKAWARWRRSQESRRLEKEVPADWASKELQRHDEEFSAFTLDPTRPTESLLGDHADWDIPLTPERPSVALKAELMSAVFREARMLSETHGVPIVVIAIPHIDHMSGSYLGVPVEEQHADYPGDRASRMVRVLARRAGLQAFDLAPLFQLAGQEALYLGDGDGHWNRAGQDLAARRIASWLTETLGLRFN